MVILAGYKDRMDSFFESNPGMQSRIAHHLDFADYDAGGTGRDRAGDARAVQLLPVPDAAEMAFRQYRPVRMRQPLFANARSVRNELERTRLRHAHRLAADRQRHWNRDDLMRIEPEDIQGGRPLPVPAIQ